MDSGFEIDGYDDLEELALDLIWAWNSSADEIWNQLDPELFDSMRNPWVLLQTVSREKLKRLLSDPTFRKKVKDLVKIDRELHENRSLWFQKTYPDSPLNYVSYFSMEFMLTEALPIYSGGLGNVSGDQLKAASDLGVPVIGIGLLYQQGYFRQEIDKEGNQIALYPYNAPGQLPISPLRKKDGEWVRIELGFPGWSLILRAWEAKVGRVRLFLLDSNDAANYPPHRAVTSELYGGDAEMRLKQELVLGIGGWRLLEMLELAPDVCHLNEGHAAFAVLERAKSFMDREKVSFETAFATTRGGNHFTTHTAVPAGFDRFCPDLIKKYLTHYADQLGIGIDRLLSMGRQNSDDLEEPFNMAYLALKGCSSVNGVSQLHAEVSRSIFSPLFPRRPTYEVPIGFITNGIHTPSWEGDAAEKTWGRFCCKGRWRGDSQGLEEEIKKIPDEEIWKMRTEARSSLIFFGRKRIAKILAARGASEEEIEIVKTMFNPDVLTIGFARRFATYKRPNMLLYDKDRLLQLLTNPKKPIQLVIAGKAHPADHPGQAMIKEWIQFINRHEVRQHVVFLTDYNMRMTERLVQGVDVWLNTPRRPWEACGTSGMKVLVNGGLNLSELDGWWVEAYSPEVGWALGDGKEHGGDLDWEESEANRLYDLLENEVVPEFYDRDSRGIPVKWIQRIRASMASLTPRFSADRAVREYTTKYYVPGAIRYKDRANSGAIKGEKIGEWEESLNNSWSQIEFGKIGADTENGLHQVKVSVYLGSIDPKSIQVELFAEGIAPKKMAFYGKEGPLYLYQTSVSADRPFDDYCPRVVPYFEGVSIPLESQLITWQR